MINPDKMNFVQASIKRGNDKKDFTSMTSATNINELINCLEYVDKEINKELTTIISHRLLENNSEDSHNGVDSENGVEEDDGKEENN